MLPTTGQLVTFSVFYCKKRLLSVFRIEKAPLYFSPMNTYHGCKNNKIFDALKFFLQKEKFDDFII